MKPENKRTASIIIGCTFILSAILSALVAVGVITSVPDITGEQIGFVAVFISLVFIIFMFFGIRSLVIGLKTYKKMKKGRIREAKVVDINPFKGSIFYKELTVSYYGE